MAEPSESASQNIRLRFTTREKAFELREAVPVLIPTWFRRVQLSQYLNSQLNFTAPIPFEILVNGSYLRTSLEDFLTQNGISAENTLTVEYVRARIPPRYIASYEHDDWVSSVHVNSDGTTNSPRILTASYDGRIRVWNSSSQVLATSSGPADAGHASTVKSAKFISSSQIASAGCDRTVKIWKYQENQDAFSANLIPSLNLYGHQASVEAVDVSGSSNRLLSASVDHTVGLWSTKKGDAPPAPEHLVPKTITKDGKRRKLNPSVTVPERGPLSLLRSHTAPVSDVRFDLKDATVAYSTSLDHTVRTWHLVSSSLVDTRNTGSALFAIEQMPVLSLLATGSADRSIRLVDPRDSAVSVVAITLKGHKNHVVTLARDPNNDYVLASGSHDGTCRIWDVRSTSSSKDGMTSQSIFTIARESLNGNTLPSTGEGFKVFSIDWHTNAGILSAGEDKSVQINSSENIT